MKVILLGANGQLGSDLQKAYQNTKPSFELISLMRQNLDVTQVENISNVLGNLNFDILINCTSYHKTDEVEKNATLAFTINTHAVKSLAEVCQKKNANFIHISTDYVFNGLHSKPYLETDSPAPINVYGASKAMGEELALLFNPQKTYILRVASLFGLAGASGKGGNFVETMIKFGKEKGVLKVVNDSTMSPSSTADIANMILKIIEHKAAPGIYHAVNSGQATWFEFAKEIIQKSKVKAELIPVTSKEFPTVALRPSFSVLSNQKLQEHIGPIRHWSNALDDYLQEKGYLS